MLRSATFMTLLVFLFLPFPGRAQEEMDLGELTREAARSLEEARQAYERADYSPAVLLINRLLEDLGPAVPGTIPVEEMQIRSDALRIRGIAYYNLGQMEAADADFSALLSMDPDMALDAKLLSPKIVAAFDEVRQKTTGLLTVRSQPPGADVRLGQRLLGATPVDPIRLEAGRYQLTVEKRGYEPMQETLDVTAGQTVARDMALLRNARNVSVMTVPSGVRILVDGVEAGVSSGSPPPGYETQLLDRGLDPAKASAPLTIPYLSAGAHLLTAVLDCHRSVEATFHVDLGDSDLALELEPLVMEKSTSNARFESVPPGADLYLDGVQVGVTPISLDGLCAGVVSVRMERRGVGIWAEDVDLLPGKQGEIVAPLKLSLMSLGAVRQLGVEDPVADAWDVFLDKILRAQDAYVAGFTSARGEDLDPERIELYRRIEASSTRFEMDETSRRNLRRSIPGDLYLVGVPSGESSGTLLIYSSHLARPDAWMVERLGEVEANGIAARLSILPQITGSWSGLTTVETAGNDFPYVLDVPSPRAVGTTLRTGDRVLAMEGRPVTSRLELEQECALRPAGSRVPVSILREGQNQQAFLEIASTPILPRPGTEGLALNKLLVDLGVIATTTSDDRVRSLSALSSGVAYMMAGKPDLALSRGLEKAMLPAGSGISRGTVDYLRGICLERMGRLDQAREAFSAAAQATAATMARDDGLLIAPLAAARAGRTP